jgi:hypothetical protein
VGKGALAPCPPSFSRIAFGGHAEPVIGRAFARPVGFAHPTNCLPRRFQSPHSPTGKGPALASARSPRGRGF